MLLTETKEAGLIKDDAMTFYNASDAIAFIKSL